MNSGANERDLIISIFCGGRGANSIIRELIKIKNIRVNALINAYDDGLSTGELRKFIPGMLGTSDFRKNLSSFLHLHTSNQYALSKILEFRMPKTFGKREKNNFKEWVLSTSNNHNIHKKLKKIFTELDKDYQKIIKFYLSTFFKFCEKKYEEFNFQDCSLGNLVFAGSYLQNNNNFNATTKELGNAFHSQVQLININSGENRILVALKENGEVLTQEEKIVSKQSPSKIIKLALIEKPLTSLQLERLQSKKTINKKINEFILLHKNVQLSSEARDAISKSDLIIYGPGTQYSSLLPSYLTNGLAYAISKSNAKNKIFIVNIHRDHDIQKLNGSELVSEALRYLGDEKNKNKLITHVLFSSSKLDAIRSLQTGPLKNWKKLRNIDWLNADLEDPIKSGRHSGFKTVRKILEIQSDQSLKNSNSLDIFVDLNKRSLASKNLIQEFMEINWPDELKKITLRINKLDNLKKHSNNRLHTKSLNLPGLFPETQEVQDWLQNRISEYLVTLTGDGEYRFCDIIESFKILKNSPFSAVYGSRNQSRYQFYLSLNAAYGESNCLRNISKIGAFIISALFLFRFGVVFSDPLTGFRIYKRSNLKLIKEMILSKNNSSATSITRVLLQNGCEIAEIPVNYITFKGFTNPKWRIFRGLHNILGIFK